MPISPARFLADVAALARALPARGHVLNVCADRYRFSVGLAAALLRGQISLLPPSTNREMVRQLAARFPDAYCLTETPTRDFDLPQTLYLDAGAEVADADPLAMPTIAIDSTVAYVFTSGSTGTPVPHKKRWGALVENVRAAAERLGIAGRVEDDLAIIATVPPQHMYGLESSVLLAWQSGAALVAERPFYPADIVAALKRLPGRRMLVTTPFHLRTLLADNVVLPSVELVLSATAPLSPELAAEAEQRLRAPLLEIYGCTETGQIASRRPTETLAWRLLGDVSLTEVEGVARVSGGHVDEPTELADVIELAANFSATREFTLVGRSADMVNIAGKRSSLGYLNTQLNAIDGVVDGAFFMPDDAGSGHSGGVTRIAAVVVAPTLDAKRIADALRTRIDPVFLPRPIYFVGALPRNATGKLTRAMLDELSARGVRSNAAHESHESPERDPGLPR